MALPFGIDAFSFIPALGAAGLSFKNWLGLRQGAVIQANNIVSYGLWGISYEGKTNKGLIIPITFSNNGTKSGMVTDIAIKFKSSSGTKDLRIRRKIELKGIPVDKLKSMTYQDYRKNGMLELNPFFPISVGSKEDESVILDCLDLENMIPLDEETMCSITVYYGFNKSTTITFPFNISRDNFEKSTESILWLRN
ncbi:MAG: hypothetical protein HeimC2_25370 [Candidatus Heimdallarchaeota archaeon LC_2]|nr:MAG: hypothetical protein HeimC2_25370 [Candidatus Heimdallarchaeota archaeon LC_2]